MACGSPHLRFRLSALVEVKSWVLGFGSSATVIDPNTLSRFTASSRPMRPRSTAHEPSLLSAKRPPPMNPGYKQTAAPLGRDGVEAVPPGRWGCAWVPAETPG